MLSKLTLIVVVSLSFLTACFHDKSDESSASGTAIKVMAISGKMVDFDGAFTRLCSSQKSGSEKNVVTISEDLWTNIWSSYDSTDCSGSVTSTEKYTGTITVGSTGAITGWRDAKADVLTAPTAADKSGSLSDTESYTMLTITLTEVPSVGSKGPAVGENQNIFYIVDDTGTGLVLYDDSDLDGGKTTASSQNPLYSTAALSALNSSSNKVSVIAVSGNSVEISGTFTAQCESGTQLIISIADDVWTYTRNKYTGVSADCSGTPNETDVWVATMTSAAAKNITGWTESSAPAKADSSGSLSDVEAYSPLTLTYSSIPAVDLDTAVGDTLEIFYVVDDTSTGLTLYPISNLAPNVTTASSSAYYSVDAVIPTITLNGPNLQITIDSAINSSAFDVNVTYTVTNAGDTDAGTFSVMLWTNRSDTQQPDYTSNQCCGFDSITSLAAGASQTGTLASVGTWFTGDTYHAYVIADFFEEVAESDEGVTGTNDNLGHITWVAQ